MHFILFKKQNQPSKKRVDAFLNNPDSL